VIQRARAFDADRSKYFDPIAHAKLLAVVTERFSDDGVLSLFKQWLKAPVIDEDGDGKRRVNGAVGTAATARPKAG